MLVVSEPRNVICTGDHDVIYKNVTSGVIRSYNEGSSAGDHNCEMKFTVRGSVKVEAVIQGIRMTSGDCTEEYLYLRVGGGERVKNSTLCYTAASGDRLVHVVRMPRNTVHDIVFVLKLDMDSDLPASQQSFIHLHFDSKSSPFTCLALSCHPCSIWIVLVKTVTS